MANKRSALTALALTLALSAAPAGAELLKLSRLQGPRPPFSLKRDLFVGAEAPGPAREAGPAEAQALQQSIAEEIANSVSYEGTILKGGKPLALLNVSGEYFTVREGETILDKIRILAIALNRVTIEYDGQPYEIRKKGED